jgi:sortase A
MKVVIAKTSLRRILQWTQRVLFAGAIVMLGYCAYVVVDSRIFQHREKQRLDRLLSDQPKTTPASAIEAVKVTPRVGPGGLIGQVQIARLGISVMVVEGTARRGLRRAAGHIPGTAMPGQPGNVGIAAHRDTFFRPLRNIQQDDVITLTTVAGEYRYRVVSTQVVSPSNVAVLNSDGNQILTLVTCYPFYFVGAAPSRFIVRAERIIG